MTKQEFENKIKQLNLEKVYLNGKIQTYTKNQKEIYRDNQRDNLYGCYYNELDKKYITFFTDAERGIVETIGEYKTEEEAYDNLFKIIKKWNEDYNKNNK